MAVRFGIVGVGNWARSVHIPNILRVKDARVAALCSRSERNRAAGAELCPEPLLRFESLEQMLACEEVDAVIVCTPNALHAAQCIEALRAGKHVLCEKPLALTLADALAVGEASRQADGVLAVGFELRSADVTTAAVAAIEEGRIGAPLMATGRFWRGWGALTGGWRGDTSRSGGVIAELFCHTADLQAYLVGEMPTCVYARARSCEGPPYWDRASAIFDYPSGAVGVGNLCLRAVGTEAEHPFEVVGEEGRLVGDIETGRLTLWQGAGEDATDISPARDASARIHGFPGSLEMIQEFADCIAGRRSAPRAGLKEGVSSVKTALAIERSIATGQPANVEG